MEILPDPNNANRGTARGLALLEKSLQRYGAGRSVLIDCNGTLIAGNKTYEAASALGIPVKVVTTDGHELVAVQRTDLDLYGESRDAAVSLALADNRVAELSLEWDADVLEELAGEDISGLDLFWFEGELQAELNDPEPPVDPYEDTETITLRVSRETAIEWREIMRLMMGDTEEARLLTLIAAARMGVDR